MRTAGDTVPAGYTAVFLPGETLSLIQLLSLRVS